MAACMRGRGKHTRGTDWGCAQELCASRQLVHMGDVVEVLADTLATPLLDDAFVAGLLDMLAELYPEEHALLADRIAAVRVPRQPPPEELCAACDLTCMPCMRVPRACPPCRPVCRL
jgi:hypothetical protein